MYPTKYKIGQQVRIVGPLSSREENSLNKGRILTWTNACQKYVDSIVNITSLLKDNQIGATPAYYVRLQNNDTNLRYIAFYHHWLLSVEDNTFGFLYIKE